MIWRHFAFTIVWALCIMVLYLLSNSQLSVIDLSTLFEPDKLAHAAVFGILTCSLCISLFKQSRFKKFRRKTTLYAFLGASIYGTLLESIHGIHSGRTFDVLDILANEVGIVLGLVIIRLIFKDIIY